MKVSNFGVYKFLYVRSPKEILSPNFHYSVKWSDEYWKWRVEVKGANEYVLGDTAKTRIVDRRIYVSAQCHMSQSRGG